MSALLQRLVLRIPLSFLFALTFVFLGRLGHRIFGGSTIRVMLGAGIALLATPSWIYFRVFYSEGLLTLATVGMLFHFTHAARRTPGELIAGGAWASVGMLSKTIGGALLPIGFLWLVMWSSRAEAPCLKNRLRWCGLAAIGAAPGGILALAYNVARTGQLLGSTYTEGIDGFGFSTPIGEGLFYLLASPGKGLLFFAPVVFLGGVGWWQRKAVGATRALGLWAGVVFAVSSSWWAWHGGECWGPRLIVPVLPALALGILGIRSPGRWMSMLVVSTVAWGALVTLLGAAIHWQAHYDRYPYTTWAEAMSEAEPGAGAEALGRNNLDPIHLEWKSSGIPAHLWLLKSAIGASSTPPPWDGEERPAKPVRVNHWLAGSEKGVPLAGLLLAVLLGAAGILFVRPTKMVSSSGTKEC